MYPDTPIGNYSQVADALGIRPGPDHTIYLDPSVGASDFDTRTTIVVCETCDTLLNRFTSPQGDPVWIHSKSWVRHDHEPVPVERPRDTTQVARMCDFCGLEDDVVWAFEGDRMRQVSGNLGNDYGSIFSACRSCAAYVDAGDLTGLINRIVSVSVIARDASDRDRDRIVEELFNMHGKYVPSIHTKTYIGPPVLPSKLDARQMHRYQRGLVKHWKHPELFEKLCKPGFQFSVPSMHADEESDFYRMQLNDDVPREVFRRVFERHAKRMAFSIEVAELYWISSDFTTLAIAAGQDLKDLTVSRDDIPSSSGLIIWETPIGEIERPYGTASIRCMSWDVIPGGVQINAYLQVEDADPTITDVAAIRAEVGHFIAPNLGSGLPFEGWEGMAISDEFRAKGNFTLTLLATWLLINQPGVATQLSAPVDKKLARAAKRAGHRLPDVRLIDLRRHAKPKEQAVESAPTGRTVSVRFMVKGHWKKQAYGPKRGMRKQIYISPFLKGPDSAPLKVAATTVKVLR